MTDPTEHPDLAHAEFQAEISLGMYEAYKAAVDAEVEAALHGDGTGQPTGFLDGDLAVFRDPTGDASAADLDPPTLLDVAPDPDPPDDPGFVARRSVMPAGTAWGTVAEQAHIAGTCQPGTCRHCAGAP